MTVPAIYLWIGIALSMFWWAVIYGAAALI